MSEKNKIDVVINEIGLIYNLNTTVLDRLKYNITKRAELYDGIMPNIDPQECSIIKDPKTITDVLLNRLVNNIREYDIFKPYAKPDQISDKGTYTSELQKITIENPKTIKDVVYNKLSNRMNNLSEDTLNKATEKVFNHEFGHALQRSFSGSDGTNNYKFNQIAKNLSNKYPNVFSMPNNSKMVKINGGANAKPNTKYSPTGRATYIDEIFNEDEALDLTGIDKPQLNYDMGNGCVKKIYNYDSSNYKISSYGKMMKILIGKERTYRSMYEDSNILYEFFDQFTNIAKSVFNAPEGVTPMQTILFALEKVRNEGNLKIATDLDLFFTKCLERKVTNDLKNANITKEDFQYIKSYISLFDNQMIKSSSGSLEQEIIMNNIKKNVMQKYEVQKSKNLSETNLENTIFNNNNNKSDVAIEKNKSIEDEDLKNNRHNNEQENYKIMIDFVYNACQDLSDKKYVNNRRKLLKDLLDIYRETLQGFKKEEQFKYVTDKLFPMIKTTIAGSAIYEDLYKIYTHERNKKYGQKEETFNDGVLEVMESLEQTYNILNNKFLKLKQEKTLDDYEVNRIFKQFLNLKNKFDDKKIMTKYIELNKFDLLYDIIQNIDTNIDYLKNVQSLMGDGVGRRL